MKVSADDLSQCLQDLWEGEGGKQSQFGDLALMLATVVLQGI